MTVKVYISGISGSQDVRKTQQRVLFILSMLPVEMEIIDITEPGRESEKAFMQEEARKHNKKDVLPPQIFNGDQYCGNYDDFQLAADDDVLMSFLKLEEPSTNSIANGGTDTKEPVVTQNGLGGDEETVTAQVDAQEVPSEEKPETEAAVENEEAVQPSENKIDVSNADEESKLDSGDAPKEETVEKLDATEGEKAGGDKTQESEEEESEEESD